MSEKKEKIQVKPSGWIALVLMMCLFSGAFAFIKGPLSFLKFLDLNTLIGSFGVIGDTKAIFAGANGTGARDGFMFALQLAPGAILAMGLIEVFTHMGVMEAFEKVFTPILRPILGVPGALGLPFVNSLNGSDVAAILTREYYNEGRMTDDERTIFVSFMYPGSAPIGNMIGTQAALLPISVLAMGPLILMVLLCKFIGANLVRLFLYSKNKKNKTAKEV